MFSYWRTLQRAIHNTGTLGPVHQFRRGKVIYKIVFLRFVMLVI